VHSVSLAGAEVYLLKRVVEICGGDGRAEVALGREHLREVIMAVAKPPKKEREFRREGLGGGNSAGADPNICSFITYGFPLLSSLRTPFPTPHPTRPSQVLLTTSTYVCPRCKGRERGVPGECRGCGMRLVSSPMIAR